MTFVPYPVTSIPLLISHGALKGAAETFLRFLEDVPEEEKRRVHFKSRFNRGSADGYCDARGVPGKDPKEFFHWAPRLREDPAYHEVGKHPAARAFFAAAEHVYRVAERMAQRFFWDEYPEFYDRCFDTNGRLYASQLRVLCYTPTTEAFRAGGHYDKGFGALALAESSRGLRLGCCRDHPMTEVRHNDGTAVFIPGQLLWEDSDRTIIPAWHDVVADPAIPHVSERCARWAIVLFLNDKEGRYPTWEETHTPLRVHELEPA